MNKKIALLPALIALVIGSAGLASAAEAVPVPAGDTVMSVTDGQLSDCDALRLSDGKYAGACSTYTRSKNKLTTNLHVTTPYLFVGARGNVTVTVYADSALGPYPLWTVTHALTACGLWDPTCSSSPAQTWTDSPPWWDAQKIQQNASFIVTTVSVS